MGLNFDIEKCSVCDDPPRNEQRTLIEGNLDALKSRSWGSKHRESMVITI